MQLCHAPRGTFERQHKVVKTKVTAASALYLHSAQKQNLKAIAQSEIPASATVLQMAMPLLIKKIVIKHTVIPWQIYIRFYKYLNVR